MSLKDERNLGELGVVAERSSLSTRTASEYVARLLLKTEAHMASCLEKQSMQCVNFCFDAATFAGEQATWFRQDCQ